MENAPVQQVTPDSEENRPDKSVEDDNVRESDIHPVLTGFNNLTILQQALVIAGIALAVALSIAAFVWSQDPSYKPLIHRLQDHNAQDILEVLQRENINFQIDPGTQILLVETGDLHQARMVLAAASLIDDKTVGLEMLDKDSQLGTSQFIENARYRRGLEGELARTIASVKSVRNARVHLALPKQSVFVRDKRKPRASVFLEIYPGRDLSKHQVEAIVNLVASSVSEMERTDVSVVDQHGTLLSKKESDEDSILAGKQLEYTEKVETSVTQAVNNILRPVLGENNYKAEVSADIDFTVQEQTEELYNPDLIALRSEQLLNEEDVDKNPGGIPGALSNQPPLDATAPEQAGGAGAASDKSVSKRSESTRNYEVDRTLSFKQHQVGRIQRLTVAVVVNDKEQRNASGDLEIVPWQTEELQRLEILVKDAVGFNAARGDSVNVINSTFMGDGRLTLGEPDFWTQPWFWEILKQLLAGVFVLILIFGVIRPTIRSIANRGKEEEPLSLLEELEDAEAGLDDETVTLSGSDEFLLPGTSESFERQLDALKGLIAEDPARVAQVVIRWINSPD